MSKQLLKAVEKGDLAKVKALLNAGAEVDWVDRSGPGRTALAEAALRGHVELVSFLLAHGADRDHKDRAVGTTPLGWASINGHREIAQLLIEAGADVQMASSGPRLTPLMYAALNGHASIVEVLLGAGADPRAQAADGRDALACATKSGHDSVVAILERAGVEPAVLAEETSLPWPDVGEDLRLVDYTRPESVLRGFILAMFRWETATVAAARDALDFDAIRAEERRAFAPFCTEKPRPQGRAGSFGVPPEYSPEEALVEIIPFDSRRVEIVTRQGKDRFLRHECRYVLVRKGTRWLLDSRKRRPIGQDGWSRAIL